MIRHAAAAVVVLCLSPSWLCAQSATLTVNTASANIHKSPSTGSPVIGQVRRGTVLQVTRELGSWVKVSWPKAQDGIGYMHVSAGSIARSSTPEPKRAVEVAPARPASDSASLAAPSVHAASTGAGSQPASSMRRMYVRPPTHLVGLGGLMGGPRRDFGATTRLWFRDHLGIQLEVSRDALTSAAAAGNVTSVQLAPSFLCSLPDHITDNVWMRPYFGAGAGLRRQTLSGVRPAGDPVSDDSLGLQVFGGTELTFASLPQLALSPDIGYRWSRTPFAGFDPGGLRVSLSAHWYVK